MNEENQNRLTGQAGVYRVATQLLLRGLVPSFPSVDCGSDLSVDGGVRIQVKAAHLAQRNTVYPQGAYWFKLQHACGKKKGQRRNFSKDCDFVVLWGIDQDRFWIIPAADFDNHSLVVVGPDLHWKDLNMELIRKLDAEGLTQAQIAERLGVQQMTISRRLRNIHVEPAERRSLTAIARQGENKWELIISAVATMKEIEVTDVVHVQER